MKGFEKFVSGNGLLNLTLSIGVVFLMHTYTKILWTINPSQHHFDLGLNVIESLFFGLVTFLVIRRADTVWAKVVFSVFECIAVFTYYNQLHKFYLSSYIAVLSASSIFALGYISLQAYKNRLLISNEEDERSNEALVLLNERLLESNDKLLDLQEELLESNLLIEHGEKEVTHLRTRVTQLEKEVTSSKEEVTSRETSLLSEVSNLKAVNKRIERDYETLHTSSREWERGFLKLEISRTKKMTETNETREILLSLKKRLEEII